MKHLKTFSKSFEPLKSNRDPNRTQYEHVAICCQPEVNDDIISGRNVIPLESYYIFVNFEVAISSNFWDFPKWLFCDGDGSSGVNVIGSRPEVADDVISGEDAETYQEYVYKFVRC